MKLLNPLAKTLLLTLLCTSNAKTIRKQHNEADQDMEERSLQTLGLMPGVILGCALCFSSHATADVLDKGPVPMNELVVGDQVLTGKGSYETLYSMAHRHPTKSADFIQIHVSDDEAPLELTEKHMLFLDGSTTPVPASTVKVGDKVQTLDGPRDVSKISTISRQGVFNPLTPDGTIVVNGIVSSAYAAFLTEEEFSLIGFAERNIMTWQSFFDKAIKPYRLLCTGVSLEFCKTSNEKVGYMELAQAFGNHWTQQGETYQFVSLMLFVALVCIMDFLLSPCSLLLAGAASGYVLISKSKKEKTL